MDELRYGVLGPLQVHRAGRAVGLGGPKERALLACLLAHHPMGVSIPALIDAIWGGTPPSTAVKTLRTYVLRLRNNLEPGRDRNDPWTVLVSTETGYTLRVAPDAIDSAEFDALAREGRARRADGEWVKALSLFDQALGLWRGEPYAEFAESEFGSLEAGRLSELHQSIRRDRAEAMLMLRHDGVVAELEHLVQAHPLDERGWYLLMLALYRDGRQAAALQAFQRIREHLVTELGVDPGPDLHRLHDQILAHDPALQSPPHNDNQDDPPDTTCPYPGLTAFNVVEGRLFFGRERLVAQGLDRLGANRFLAVVGPSGSGKSSLARAGLLASLNDKATAGHEHWHVVAIRPGAHPMASLAAGLATKDSASATAVLVDQFEEVFTECANPAERTEFFDALVRLTEDPARFVAVIVVVRADFYGQCAAHADIAVALAQSQLLVGPMGEAELRRAIERPAQQTGLRLDEGLADALVADVADQPGALPLLATALRELWDRRKGQVLTLESYVETGGVLGAVARLAERAYGELPPSLHATAQRVLFRLAAPGEGTRMVRRRVSRSELAGMNDANVDLVVNALADHRLLSADDDGVEIAHEAVLWEWPRLRAWLEEDLEGLRTHRTLTAAAEAWEQGGRDPDEVLRGVRLASIVQWAETRPVELTRTEADYLNASRAAADRTLAEARTREAAKARSNRRLRWLAFGLTLALLVAAVAGVFATVQSGHAQDSARKAQARQLAARAGTEPDLDRALLVALAGTHLDDSTTTRGALLSALIRTEPVVAVDILPESSMAAVLEPDGKRLINLGVDGAIRRLDLVTRTSQLVDRVSGFPGQPALSPDGRTLAVPARVGTDSRVIFWDLTTGQRVGEHPIGPGTAHDVAWHPDGQALAVVRKDEVVVLDRAGRTPAIRIPFPGLGGWHSTDVDFVPAGLVVSNPEQTVLYDPATGVQRHQVPIGGPLAFSPTRDAALLGGGTSGKPGVLDLGRGEVTVRLDELPDVASAVAWHGSTVAVSALDHATRVWRLRPSGPPELVDTLRGHTSNVIGTEISPDGRTLYTAALDQRVISWDLSGERRFWRTTSTGQSYPRVDVRPDGRLTAVGDGSGQVNLYESGTAVKRTLPAASSAVTAVAFAPDSVHLAVADADGRVVLWNVNTGTQAGDHWDTGGGRVSKMQFSPDGKLLLAGTAKSGARLWSVGDRVDRGRLPGPSQVLAASFVRSDTVVLSGPDGDLLTVRLTPDGPQQDWQTRLNGPVAAIGVADGRLFAGTRSGWLHGWDFETKQEVWPPRRVPGGTVGPGTLVIDRHGALVAAGGGGGGQTYLWDVRTGVRVADLAHPKGDAAALVFDPSTDKLVTISSVGHLVQWDLDAATWRKRACAIAGRDLTATEWVELDVPAPAQPLCAAPA